MGLYGFCVYIIDASRKFGMGVRGIGVLKKEMFIKNCCVGF